MLKQEKIVLVFLSVFLLVTTLLAYLSTGTYESGDSIQHYLIARYSFKHPELLLDHWGKPFFTLLASPFAQFGFFGICMFNILCATTTGFIAYKIARKLSLDKPWLASVFVLFTPIYYVTLISGLTEPLFGLVLLAAIYYCLHQKLLLASIIVSFLPFIRTEGFLLLPIFALVFITQKKYSACLLLLSGTVIYSIAGYFYYHNLLWIWTENPYKGAKDIYGNGSLFHFISKNEFILGTPLVILFVLGIAGYFFRKNKSQLNELLLISGVFFTYLFMHSIFWWKGVYSSLGLIRVMAGVSPLAAVIALRGLNMALQFPVKIKSLQNYSIVKSIFLVLVIALVIWMPFKQHQFPRPLSYEDEVVKEAADWVKKNQSTSTKFSYQYPYLSIFLDIDPFDNIRYIPLWSLVVGNVLPGTIIIWDSHYGPNEARLPLSTFVENSNLELLTSFKADPAKTPGDKEIFEVFVFKCK